MYHRPQRRWRIKDHFNPVYIYTTEADGNFLLRKDNIYFFTDERFSSEKMFKKIIKVQRFSVKITLNYSISTWAFKYIGGCI